MSKTLGKYLVGDADIHSLGGLCECFLHYHKGTDNFEVYCFCYNDYLEMLTFGEVDIESGIYGTMRKRFSVPNSVLRELLKVDDRFFYYESGGAYEGIEKVYSTWKKADRVSLENKVLSVCKDKVDANSIFDLCICLYLFSITDTSLNKAMRRKRNSVGTYWTKCELRDYDAIAKRGRTVGSCGSCNSDGWKCSDLDKDTYEWNKKVSIDRKMFEWFVNNERMFWGKCERTKLDNLKKEWNKLVS